MKWAALYNFTAQIFAVRMQKTVFVSRRPGRVTLLLIGDGVLFQNWQDKHSSDICTKAY